MASRSLLDGLLSTAPRSINNPVGGNPTANISSAADMILSHPPLICE